MRLTQDDHIIQDISVILPCFNESHTIPQTLEILSEFLDSINRKYEIIVSDDGSTDMTPKLDWQSYYNQFCVRYIRSDINSGKGAALRQGLLSSRSKFIFLIDSDLPVELEALARCLTILENNEADLVIGDRKLSESKAIGSAPKSRFIASKLFNLGVQILVLPGYTDTQCPMKGITREAMSQILPACFLTSFAFDVELLYLAKLHGMRIKRLPVTWRDARADIPVGKLTYLVLTCLKDVALVRLKN